ncbi:MAG: methyltransferase domain-containing protein [Pseudomonadota bacterium]
MSGPNIPKGLWSDARDGAGLRNLYDDWAERYDADMEAGGMIGPQRLAAMLQRLLPDRSAPILDFGCGTGLSGAAANAAGYTDLHGQDISAGMLDVARRKGVYTTLTETDPDAPIRIDPAIRAVLSSGSICVGAGPATLLPQVAEAMPTDAILLISYNDDTLRDAGYMEALANVQVSGLLRLELAEYGPQLPALNRGATAYALRRL